MEGALIRSFIPTRWEFKWRYWRRQTPWDTQVTPPEVMEFIARTPPGKALDLGCGTGTNAITLARHGWQVDGRRLHTQSHPCGASQSRPRAGLAIDFLAAERHRPPHALSGRVRLRAGHRLPVSPWRRKTGREYADAPGPAAAAARLVHALRMVAEALERRSSGHLYRRG